MTHMDKNQREARRRQEDQALNRGLMWVGGAIVLEFLLLLVNRYYITFKISEVGTAELIWNGLKLLRIAGVVLGVAALVWAGFRFRKGGKNGLCVVLALVCGALATCAHIILVFQKPGVQMLFLMVPAWAGLALVYYLYQREFFLGAAASGMSVLGLWFVRYGGRVGLETVLTLVGILLVAAATLWLKKNNGVIHRTNGEEVRFLSKKASYPMILVSCLVGLVALLAAMILGANIAYYLMFAMVAWLFALLVYYTVKLM